MHAQHLLWLTLSVIITWKQCIGTTDLYKYIDDEQQGEEGWSENNDGLIEESIDVQVANNGDVTMAELEELEDEIQQELNANLKECPHPHNDPFQGSQQDFIDLLMATEYVKTCQLTLSTDSYWKFYVESYGIKVWNSYLTVLAGTNDEFWCLMQCDFTPEKQLKNARKYIFVNEWNKEQIFRPHLFVGVNGTVSMERSFAIKNNWIWSVVYDLFSLEIKRFLESIDLMQSQLRTQEDAAKLR